jgi:hypothetical protein
MRRGDPEHGVTLGDELVAQGGEEMAFPSAGAPDGHDVDGLADEGPGTQTLDL